MNRWVGSTWSGNRWINELWIQFDEMHFTREHEGGLRENICLIIEYFMFFVCANGRFHTRRRKNRLDGQVVWRFVRLVWI